MFTVHHQDDLQGSDLTKLACSQLIKVPMKQIFLLSLFEIAFKMTKSGDYFIVVALLVAELFKILIYANQITCDVTV